MQTEAERAGLRLRPPLLPPPPQAFQVSEQCVRLWREGWFQPEAKPSGSSVLRNPRDLKDAAPVIVAGKDAGEVDNDYFLIPVGIRDHEGPLAAAFPIENRLLPQGKAELRAALQRGPAGQAYAARLADFHLLLFLARQPNFEPAGGGWLAVQGWAGGQQPPVLNRWRALRGACIARRGAY